MSNKPKEVRRAAALERQAEYDKLSLQQKLERLDRQRGVSKKQRARLLKLIEAQKTQASNQGAKLAGKQAHTKKS